MCAYSSATHLFYRLIRKCKKNLQITLSRGNVIVYGISLDCHLCNLLNLNRLNFITVTESYVIYPEGLEDAYKNISHSNGYVLLTL